MREVGEERGRRGEEKRERWERMGMKGEGGRREGKGLGLRIEKYPVASCGVLLGPAVTPLR